MKIIILITLATFAFEINAQNGKIPSKGKTIYESYCLTCHMEDGKGVPGLNPPLVKTTYVLGDKSALIKIILKGLQKPIEIDGETYRMPMPAHNYLTDKEIAEVLTYVRSSFGNKATGISEAEVKKVRASK